MLSSTRSWPARRLFRSSTGHGPRRVTSGPPQRENRVMMHRAFLAFALSALWSGAASAFCGFYVARADTKLYNQASQVVLVRDGDRTVLTMANDYQGEPAEFAVVVPVPTFLERGQIHVGESAVIEH